MEVKDINEIKPTKSFNLGTQKGSRVLKRSIKELGCCRSIVVDRNNQILAGNEVDKSMERIEEFSKEVSIHEFQAGVIYTYKGLQKLNKNVISFVEGGFFCKNVLYDVCLTEKAFKEHIFRNDIISTQLYKEYKPEKRVEVCYDLQKVFERSSYAKAKSYYKSVSRPFNICKRYGFVVRKLNTQDLCTAKKLLYRWIEIKLANPKVFRMMFPEKRYERCLDCSFTPPRWCNKQNGTINNIGLFDSNGELLGFRVVYVIKEKCYDLAYITNRELEIESFSEVFEAATLKYIIDTYNVTFFNCGLSQGELKRFKQKLPNKEVVYYRYKKQ